MIALDYSEVAPSIQAFGTAALVRQPSGSLTSVWCLTSYDVGISCFAEDSMTFSYGRVSLIAAIAALIGGTACNRSGPVADEGLKRDLAAASGGGLELAPTASRSQVVVSAIEGGPRSTPTRAAQKRTPTRSPRPTVRVAERQAPAPAPEQKSVTTEPSPVVALPTVEQAPAPITRPAPAPARQNRVYKTEAEIFRDMPWIRP